MLRPCSHFLQRTAWLGSPGLPRPGTPLTGAQSCGKRVAVTLRCQCCHAGHGASQRSGHSLRTQAQRPGPRHRRLLSLWGYGRCLAPGWDHGVGKNTALRAGGPRGPLPTASQTLGGREVSSPRALARGRRPGWAVVGFSDGPVVTLTPEAGPAVAAVGGRAGGCLLGKGLYNSEETADWPDTDGSWATGTSHHRASGHVRVYGHQASSGRGAGLSLSLLSSGQSTDQPPLPGAAKPNLASRWSWGAPAPALAQNHRPQRLVGGSP